MRSPLAWGMGLIVATLLLGLWIASAGTPGIDPAIVRALEGFRARPGFWLAMTRIGDGELRVPVTFAFAAFLVFRRQLPAALVLISVTLVQSLTNSALKSLFARPRPDLLAHLDTTFDLSYPSGHAAQNAAIYLLVALLIDRRLLAIALPLVLLIGVSRIILGVHWPSDVLGGWLEGAGFALIGVAIARKSQTMLHGPMERSSRR